MVAIGPAIAWVAQAIAEIKLTAIPRLLSVSMCRLSYAVRELFDVDSVYLKRFVTDDLAVTAITHDLIIKFVLRTRGVEVDHLLRDNTTASGRG